MRSTRQRRIGDHTPPSATGVTGATPSLRYRPTQTHRRAPLRETALLIAYHARLLNRWLFLLMAFGFLGVGGLIWLALRVGGSQATGQVADLSRFLLEPGAGLIAALLASSLVVGDPLLEVLMATHTGIRGVVIWRTLLTFGVFLLCSAGFLVWSLANGVNYAKQQSPLYLALVWLAPVLVMGALGLLGALATRNAALGLALAMVPLAGSLFLYAKLSVIQATHPYYLSYTFSGGQDAADWWINRVTLLGVALALAILTTWLLGREEHLLGGS